MKGVRPFLMSTEQPTLFKLPLGNNTIAEMLCDIEPAYVTQLGAAYLGDSLETLSKLPSETVDLVVTSPPYALHFKKEYGNVSKGEYVEWFKPFAREVYRVLRPQGSFVLNIGGSYNSGAPTRSLYHFKGTANVV